MRLHIGPRLHLAFRIIITTILLSSVSHTAAPQQTSQNWWTLNSERDLAEKGKLREILTKKKVYVNVSFSDNTPNSHPGNFEQNSVNRAVNEAISAHKEFQRVTYPEEAEFAVIVRAATAQGTGDRGPNFSLLLDAEAEVSLEVLVLVPGSHRPDGTRMPRLVWDASSPNTQIEAASAARFTIDGFLWELRKLREKK
ncbi:MAG TPA: hypothetical protein VFR18_01010 [Terriglobia bacterium]|nr:hypothetical protein [Terriglobia bacterium]